MAFPQTVTELISSGYFEVLNEKEKEIERKRLNFFSKNPCVSELIKIQEELRKKERQKYLKIYRRMLQVAEPEEADCSPKHKSKAVLPVEETLSKQEGKKTKNKVSSTPDNYILDPEKPPIIYLEDLPRYRGKKWSPSAVTKGKWKRIPKKCWADHGYDKKPKDYSFIAKEIITWRNGEMSPNEPLAGEPDTSQDKKTTKIKHRFIFTIKLEPLINDLAKEEKYLDKENADLMVDCFSKKPKFPMGRKIKWKKDANSLLTFIYLSDRLEYIDRSIPSNFSEHITTTDTDIAGIKEEYEEGKEVLYQEFVVENFEIGEGGKSEGTLSREWRKINTAILGLYSQVAKGDKENLTTRAKTIKYYFKNKEKAFQLNRNKEEYIDKEILEKMRLFYSAKLKFASL